MQDLREQLQSFEPLAAQIAGAGTCKSVEALLVLGRGTSQGHQFVDGHRLELALDLNQIEFAEEKACALNGLEGAGPDENVSAVLLVQTLETRREVYGVAHGGVAVAQLRAHVPAGGRARPHTDAQAPGR